VGNLLLEPGDCGLYPALQYQVRYRRPTVEVEWTTNEPQLTKVVMVDDEPHTFAVVKDLDQTFVPMAEAAADGLPSSALGPKPDNSLLTFEFQIRMTDGGRWSPWSNSTDPFVLAKQPELLLPYEGEIPKVMCSRIARNTLSKDAQLVQYTCKWPNFPAEYFLRAPENPELHQLPLPLFQPPPLAYRVNVWAQAAEAPEVLFRQHDLPPQPYPKSLETEDDDAAQDKELQVTIVVLPEQSYRVTVEAHFRFLNVDYWTPIFSSDEFFVETVPPPPPPKAPVLTLLPTKNLAEIDGLVVAWPWRADHEDYVLEYSDAPGPKSSDDEVSDRPQGPWKEVGTELVSDETFQELGLQCRVAKIPDVETNFAFLRWRMQASIAALAVVPPHLHVTPASPPIRLMVAEPEAPDVRLTVSEASTRLTLEVNWEAWAQALTHQLSYRVIRVPKRKKRSGRRSTSKDMPGAVIDDGPSGISSAIYDGESKMSMMSMTQGRSDEFNPDMQAQSGASGIPGLSDLVENRPRGVSEAESGAPSVASRRPSKDAAGIQRSSKGDIRRSSSKQHWNLVRVSMYDGGLDDLVPLTAWQELAPMPERSAFHAEESAKRSFNRPIPSTVWNDTLSRYYDYVDAAARDADAGQTTEVENKEPDSEGEEGRSRKFRMQFGHVVEWRVRVADERTWSQWSPSKIQPVVPPMPLVKGQKIELRFSRQDPTIARIAWRVFQLPEGYEHLAVTMEYVVSLNTSDGSSLLELAGRHGQTAEQTRLADRGISLSEKTCGILDFEAGKSEDKIDIKTPEVRIVGQCLHPEARLVNFDAGADIGFEMTVSGI
jgi:hypothetical protein